MRSYVIRIPSIRTWPRVAEALYLKREKNDAIREICKKFLKKKINDRFDGDFLRETRTATRVSGFSQRNSSTAVVDRVKKLRRAK